MRLASEQTRNNKNNNNNNNNYIQKAALLGTAWLPFITKRRFFPFRDSSGSSLGPLETYCLLPRLIDQAM